MEKMKPIVTRKIDFEYGGESNFIELFGVSDYQDSDARINEIYFQATPSLQLCSFRLQR